MGGVELFSYITNRERLYVHRNPWADRADRRRMDLLETGQHREPGIPIVIGVILSGSRRAGCENGARVKERRI